MKLPIQCPACDNELTVVKLHCDHCETQVSGKFLLNSGSLKEMANKLGKSYPTVRNKLDELIDQVKSLQSK